MLNPDVDTDTTELSTRLTRTLGKEALDFIDAQELSARLLGDAIGQNVMLLGAAYQKGLLPVGLEALEQAIEMNGVSIRMNREAFAWGPPWRRTTSPWWNGSPACVPTARCRSPNPWLTWWRAGPRS